MLSFAFLTLQETAYILRHATPNSLVLIDELGRATSTADGLGVAWAVAETLAASGARTLLATHFAELAGLADMYPQCRVWHFSVDTSSGRLDYQWELKSGRCPDKHYGLALAASVAFPEEALERARNVVQGNPFKKSSIIIFYNSVFADICYIYVFWDNLAVCIIFYYYFFAVLDGQEAEAANAEIDAEQQEERAIWEIVGKLATLAQIGPGPEEEEAILDQVSQLQQEAAELLG